MNAAPLRRLERRSAGTYRSLLIWHRISKDKRKKVVINMFNTCRLFGQSLETFFLAANILERVRPSVLALNESNLGLYGLTAVYVASKFCEHNNLHIDTIVEESLCKEFDLPFSSSCDDSPEQLDIEKKTVLQAEHKLLDAIQFELHVPTLYNWLSLVWTPKNKRLKRVCQYLAVELVQTDTPNSLANVLDQAKAVRKLAVSICTNTPPAALSPSETSVARALASRLAGVRFRCSCVYEIDKPIHFNCPAVYKVTQRWLADLQKKK